MCFLTSTPVETMIWDFYKLEDNQLFFLNEGFSKDPNENQLYAKNLGQSDLIKLFIDSIDKARF